MQLREALVLGLQDGCQPGSVERHAGKDLSNSGATLGLKLSASMEATALEHPHLGVRGPTPLLRLQGDERLVALTRKGNQAAYEALVARYQSRLLAFCRHMLSSKEDAEDVLQEVFAAAFNALLADDRPINVRPWLYRIARNRSLNHLRRQQAIGVDSMDIHFADFGKTTVEHVQGREAIRELLEDVKTLPETQRTALLLREIDALSYEQISEAMETTVPSVKSLLVRARVSLAEAAEARAMTCGQVREELGEVAEGLRRLTSPARRHVRTCDRCGDFRDHLKQTNKALAAIFPVGPLIMLKKFLLAQVGTTAGASSAAGAATGAGGAAAGAAAGGSAITAGVSAVATKAAAGLAAVAIVSAGAVEVDHAQQRHVKRAPVAAARPAQPVAAPAPRVISSVAQPVVAPRAEKRKPAKTADAKKPKPTTTTPATTTSTATTTTPATPPPAPQQESDATTLPQTTPTTTTTGTPPPTTTTTTTTTTEQPPPPSDTTTTDQSPPPPPPGDTTSTDQSSPPPPPPAS
jgi:RNA polymerase sigma factor (sigma-70 family)